MTYNMVQKKISKKKKITKYIVNPSNLTSTSVPQQVAVNILYGGVDSGPTGHTTGGHIRVCLRVDILETFPGHTGAEL